MANTKSAEKQARQAIKRHKFNQSHRSLMRNSIKKLLIAIDQSAKSKDVTQSNKLFRELQSIVDSLARKGIIKPNKAARHKHRLNLKIKNIALKK
ncbi:MAG: 30S ribosomal protein S20 [Methylacidiphilales bacterium]|nr:30S ribosomal protein S20 [Candidatus Methylacidiphilales bacterium]